MLSFQCSALCEQLLFSFQSRIALPGHDVQSGLHLSQTAGFTGLPEPLVAELEVVLQLFAPLSKITDGANTSLVSQLLVGMIELTLQLSHAGVSSFLTSSAQESLIGSFQLLDLSLCLVSGSYSRFQFRGQVSYSKSMDSSVEESLLSAFPCPDWFGLALAASLTRALSTA